MTTIILTPGTYVFDAASRTFKMSEKNTKRFDTTYELRNPKTGGSEKFEFTHSTGPEFDPKTVWVYKSSTGLTLEVANDAEWTKQSLAAYLEGKLKK